MLHIFAFVLTSVPVYHENIDTNETKTPNSEYSNNIISTKCGRVIIQWSCYVCPKHIARSSYRLFTQTFYDTRTVNLLCILCGL